MTKLLINEREDFPKMTMKKPKYISIKIDQNSTVNDGSLLKTHPDGGWGWVVVIAAFLSQFIVVGLQNSSGVIFNELVKKFNRPRGQTGFVSSISCGMMFILGPITTSLCQRFGCRSITIVGGILCSLGMFASAYASSLEIMYVTFGFTWGLGTSFCYFPTLIILVPYFDKRLALVNGLVSSGSGIGTLILSPFLSWFADKYGVKNMFFALTALHGIVICAGVVYRPINEEYRRLQGSFTKNRSCTQEGREPERQNTQERSLSTVNIKPNTNIDNCDNTNDNKNEREKVKQLQYLILISLFKDKAFLTWCLGLSVFMLGYFVPFVHIVRYAKLIGIAEVKAAFLISVLSIVATICKVVSGKVAGFKRIDTFKMYQIGLLIMGVATTLLPVTRSYVGLICYAIVFGISESCFIVMIPLITKDIVGVQRLPLALGCVFMLMGIPTVIGAPIAGWIYDAFRDYSYAFYVAGSMNILGVLIMFLVVFFRENKSNVLAKKTIATTEAFTFIGKESFNDNIFYFSRERIYYSHLDLLELNIYHEHYNDNNVDHLQYIYGCVTTPTISSCARSPTISKNFFFEENLKSRITFSDKDYRPESPMILQ